MQFHLTHYWQAGVRTRQLLPTNRENPRESPDRLLHIIQNQVIPIQMRGPVNQKGEGPFEISGQTVITIQAAHCRSELKAAAYSTHFFGDVISNIKY
jgi:hypothetical protein